MIFQLYAKKNIGREITVAIHVKADIRIVFS